MKDKVLLDTNAVIAVLSGHDLLVRQLSKAKWLGISVISHIEFLSFPNLLDEDKALFAEYLKQLVVLGVEENNTDLIETIVRVRKQYRLKLPDAIIAAMAIYQNADLVTADHGFHAVSELSIVQF